MQRLSPKTIARRQAQYAASKAAEAELTARLRALLPELPPEDDWKAISEFGGALKEKTQGLKWRESRLLAVALNREMTKKSKEGSR